MFSPLSVTSVCWSQAYMPALPRGVQPRQNRLWALHSTWPHSNLACVPMWFSTWRRYLCKLSSHSSTPCVIRQDQVIPTLPPCLGLHPRFFPMFCYKLPLSVSSRGISLSFSVARSCQPLQRSTNQTGFYSITRRNPCRHYVQDVPVSTGFVAG